MAASAGTVDRSAGRADIFLIAGESSGDALGASLMDALRARSPKSSFRGVGGQAMAARGLASLFPMSDIAVMGFLPVILNLRRLMARIAASAQAIIANPPDVLVIIDSPDFTHRVARRVRAARPDIPIVDYVSPSVWAWRPRRARAMRAYIDHILALLPFEPAVHKDLGGPACTYVGHPLIERLDDLRPATIRRSGPDNPLLVLLPGSRHSEFQRLMPVFGDVVEQLAVTQPDLQTVLPAVAHLAADIERAAERWRHRPEIVLGEDAKFQAFGSARAALAASGTVTLELALARTPTVLAYKVSAPEFAIARRLVRTPWIGLPNIIAGRAIIPEFIQHEASSDNLCRALLPLLKGGPERDAQLQGFHAIEQEMLLPEGQAPSAIAAQIVLEFAGSGRK